MVNTSGSCDRRLQKPSRVPSAAASSIACAAPCPKCGSMPCAASLNAAYGDILWSVRRILCSLIAKLRSRVFIIAIAKLKSRVHVTPGNGHCGAKES